MKKITLIRNMKLCLFKTNFSLKKRSSTAARIRTQVFLLPVDCSEPQSYVGIENNLLLRDINADRQIHIYLLNSSKIII